MKRTMAALAASGLMLLGGCGGGSEGSPALQWSAVQAVAQLPANARPLDIKPENGGGVSVLWWSGGQQSWVRRGSDATSNWATVPDLPVTMRFSGTQMVGWFTGSDGPLGALVFDDGRRTDDTGLVDLDPRLEFLQTFTQTAKGWSGGPEIPVPEFSGRGALCPAGASPQTGEAFCLVPWGLNTLGRGFAELRYRPGQGWSGPTLLDPGPGGSPLFDEGTLAIQDSGRALALWSRQPAGPSTPGSPAFHVYEPASGWSELGLLNDIRPMPSSPRAVPIPQGFLAAYRQCNPTHCWIGTKRYVAGTGWESAQRISPEIAYTTSFVGGFQVQTPFLTGPVIAAGPNGHATVFWHVNSTVTMRRFDPASGWADAVEVPAALLGVMSEPRVVRVDETGRVAAVTSTAMARYVPGAGWSPVTAPPWPAGTDALSIGMDGQRRIVAVWAVPRNSGSGIASTELFAATVR